jgi:hypothetical protein
MKNLPLLAALLAVATALPVAAVEDHQQHQAADHTRLSLDHGRQWATDKPLRDGMTHIRATMASKLEQIHRDKLTAEQYHAMGATIQQQVSTIIAQCKLDSKADAMLHIVLADLLAGADAMQGKGAMTPASGAHKVVEAMNAYGEHFNHPGWRSLP